MFSVMVPEWDMSTAVKDLAGNGYDGIQWRVTNTDQKLKDAPVSYWGRNLCAVELDGCPAEEQLGGKVWMVREGYFNGVDAALSHHPGSTHTASIRSSTALISVKFHFHGKTSHAAISPHHGISALDAAELMNTRICAEDRSVCYGVQ